MSVDTLLDFPQARRVSPDILRRLREIDETATVVHLGGPTWLVGKVRPNAASRQAAITMLDSWSDAVLAGKRMSATGKARVQFALLALRGFRPVQMYHIAGGEPDARIINEFRESRWRWLHTSDNELFQHMDNLQDEQKARNEALLTDEGLARDAWRYAFTRSHAPGVSNTPKDRVRSGFTRTLSIS